MEETFSDLILKAYEKRGETIRAFAQGLGLSHQYAHDILHGRIPGEDVICLLADYLGLNPYELLLLAREERAPSERVAKMYAELRASLPTKADTK